MSKILFQITNYFRFSISICLCIRTNINIIIIIFICTVVTKNILKMPINVLGNSSHDNNKEIDTSLFVQKPYLRTNSIESNTE